MLAVNQMVLRHPSRLDSERIHQFQGGSHEASQTGGGSLSCRLSSKAEHLTFNQRARVRFPQAVQRGHGLVVGPRSSKPMRVGSIPPVRSISEPAFDAGAQRMQLREDCSVFSSNGKTPAIEAGYAGSNPCVDRIQFLEVSSKGRTRAFGSRCGGSSPPASAKTFLGV